MSEMQRRQFLTAAGTAGIGLVLSGVGPLLRAATPIKPGPKAALLLIDARTLYPESAAPLRARAKALLDDALRAKPSLRPDYVWE